MRKTAFSLALTLVVAACGGTGDTTTLAPATTAAAPTTQATTTAPPTTTATPTVAAGFPVTVAHGTGEVTLADQPISIVSISPTATEILFAIGAADQVIAVDSLSTYPAEAPVTDLSAFEANVEAIAEFEPDLVIMSFDPGDVESGLTALGIPVIMQFSAFSLEDAYTQIDQLGAATGRSDESDLLVDEIAKTVADFKANAALRDQPLTYYHELDNTFYSVTSSTFIGEIYAVLGLDNVADPADEEGYGYPQLSPEFILETDPDLIFLADTRCCAQTATSLEDRPGWDRLSAVRNGLVTELDDDVASRWGPRIIEFLEAIAAAIAAHDARTDG
ncbi:MAG: ABC transporter substrate-binding protein [bacterium]|nr:ABC transporter substrate-binding protein [bacterium]